MNIIKISIISIVIMSCLMLGLTSAQNSRRGSYGSNPQNILDAVVDKANEDRTIQQTQLDSVSRQQGAYPSEYRIANTLDALRIAIAPYLQRAAYIALAVATIGIIYNGFQLVTGQGDLTTARTNITNILIGVVIVTGFYAIIRIFVSLMSAIFSL